MPNSHKPEPHGFTSGLKAKLHLSPRKEPPVANRPPDLPSDFRHFKNEYLLFFLYAIREIRRMFEAAASSRWITYWTVSLVLGGSSPWILKTFWTH
jgi:hypothetical protein